MAVATHAKGAEVDSPSEGALKRKKKGLLWFLKQGKRSPSVAPVIGSDRTDSKSPKHILVKPRWTVKMASNNDIEDESVDYMETELSPEGNGMFAYL